MYAWRLAEQPGWDGAGRRKGTKPVIRLTAFRLNYRAILHGHNRGKIGTRCIHVWINTSILATSKVKQS